MENRRGDKIVEIEEYLDKLGKFVPGSLDEYVSDEKTKAACERYFEKVVEAVVDLAFFIIKEKGLRSPESSRESFEILAENRLISKELALSLGNAKSMRNWLAHQYGKVDDGKVFDAIRNEIVGDVEKLMEAVR